MSNKDDLAKIRDSIDSIDNQILSLINERAKLAIQAGQAKQDKDKYKPARESSILNRLIEINKLKKEGPLNRKIFCVDKLYIYFHDLKYRRE